MGILYTINPTGFIGGHSTNKLSPDKPVLTALEDGNKTLLLPDFIPALVTVNGADGTKYDYPDKVGVSWYFSLDAVGNPLTDKNGFYVVTPPQPSVSPPDSSMYLVIAGLRNKTIALNEVADDYVVSANRSLYFAGLPLIPGTKLMPLPILTAKTTAKFL